MGLYLVEQLKNSFPLVRMKVFITHKSVNEPFNTSLNRCVKRTNNLGIQKLHVTLILAMNLVGDYLLYLYELVTHLADRPNTLVYSIESHLFLFDNVLHIEDARELVLHSEDIDLDITLKFI